MKIWLTRHGQTNLNSQRLMQGLTDEPLNDTGREQAKAAREKLGDVKFDAVFASPLIRAIETASIIGNVPQEDIIVDPRIIEIDFGKYELHNYDHLGPRMSAFWVWPEVIPAPDTVETIPHMVERCRSFLLEMKDKDYENVLVVCHGGIIRVLSGILEGRKNNLKWRPRPENCEIRIYDTKNIRE